MTSLRIAALSIGDELLDGRIKDGNTHDLGNALSALGLELGAVLLTSLQKCAEWAMCFCCLA